MSARLMILVVQAGALAMLVGGIAAPLQVRGAVANPPAKQMKSGQDPFADLAERQRNLALAAESEGELPRAYQHWEAVSSLNPQDGVAKAKLALLHAQIRERAEQYFRDGNAFYQKDEIGPAFKALLRGLAYDPTNAQALKRVKEDLNAKSVVEYRVQPGDTLETIAAKQKNEGYNDPAMAVVISTYNDLKPGQAVSAGRVLLLPVMVGVPYKAPSLARRGGRAAAAGTAAAKGGVTEPAAQAGAEESTEYDDTESNTQADAARELLTQNRFEEAATLAAKVVAEDPVNKDAREVRNESYYKLGRQRIQEKNFQAALMAFSRVEPSYRDLKADIVEAQGGIVDKAELSYVEGVNYFLADDLENAIKAFELTLKLNPNHPQAQKDLLVARDTRDKLSKVR